MSEVRAPLDATALRHEFDAGFARAAAPQVQAGTDLIGITLGESAYAVRVSQIAGFRAGLAVTPCPTPVAELLGVAGIGGVLIPVYDLAALLGLGSGAGRWTILVEQGTLALAFQTFTGHFRVESAAIAPRGDAAGIAQVNGVVLHAGRSWPVLDMPSVVATIRGRLPSATTKE